MNTFDGDIRFGIYDLQFGPVPEPSSLLLLSIGAIGLFAWQRRRWLGVGTAIRSLLLVAAILLVSFPMAQARTVISHIGDNDPLYESPVWALDNRGGVNGPVNDDGTPAWNIRANGIDSYYAYYDEQDVTDPTGWTATAKVKVNDNCDDTYAATLQVDDPLYGFFLGFVGAENPEDSGIWYMDTRGYISIHLVQMETRDAYHAYQKQKRLSPKCAGWKSAK